MIREILRILAKKVVVADADQATIQLDAMLALLVSMNDLLDAH